MAQDVLMGIMKLHSHYTMILLDSQITGYNLRTGSYICKEKCQGTINSRMTDYVNFMKELMLKGYETESTAAAENGKCWYLPHHGVHNSNKPGKIRIVFD